jgi:hypothetical protein
MMAADVLGYHVGDVSRQRPATENPNGTLLILLPDVRRNEEVRP